ncbi:MAG: hypothetical protein ACE5F9_10130 [Phycisphaerae bacterium]
MFMTSAVSLLVSTFCLADAPDRPPKLTLDKPVDYIAWYDDFVRRGRTENALDLYKGLYSDGDGQGGIQALEGAAEAQYEKVKARIWEPKDYPELASYLEECEPFLKIATKAVERKDFWQPATPRPERLLDVKLPILSATRHASKALLARSWMRQDDRAAAMIDAYRVTLRMADHMQQGGVQIGGLVGLAERGLVYDNVLAALSTNVIQGKDIAAAYETLRRYDPKSPDWERMITFEWAMVLDTLQYVKHHGSFDILGMEMSVSSPPDPAQTLRFIDEYYATLVSLPGKWAFTARNTQRIGRYCGQQKKRIRNDPFLAKMGLAATRAHQLLVRGETRRRGTLLTLAILEHHHKQGKWPKSLDDLKRKSVKQIRTDPFSGADFIYRLAGDQPVLYSVGSDGKDDGARHNAKWDGGGDYVFWPYPGR